MSVPIGIGSFAAGLVQGMRMKKDDERQAEQDAMRRQEFNLQQESRQFDLSNARKVGERQDAEYTRAQGIQQKQDAFKKNFDSAYTAFRSGNEVGAITGVEATLNDPTLGLPHKAVVDRDASGNPIKGPKGYTLRYMDPATGKEVSRVEGDADTILGGAYVAHDAIGEYGKQEDAKTKASDRAAEKKDKIEIMTEQYNLIDRNNSRSSYRSGSSDGESGESSRTKKNSKYSLDDEIKALFPADAGIVPVVRKQKVQVINNGLTVALQGRDASERARGWNEAYQGFLDVIKNADINRNLTPRQTEEQAMLMFDNHLRKTYGVGYDDAMTQLGLVDPKTLPKKGRAQQPAPAGNSPKTPAQTLVDPVKQRRDTQNAYKQANNFITGGGF